MLKKKWVRWLLALGVLFFVVVPFCLLMIAWIFIDPIGEKLIETGGTEVLGVRTEVGSFHCSILTGSVAVNAMTIDDPAGFDASRKAFSLGQVATGVSLGSLSSDTIEINELVIDDLKLYLEANDSTTNIQTILKNVERNTGSGATATPPPDSPESTPPPAAESGPETRFKIALIRLRNLSMDLKTTWPVESKAAFTIPPFEMKEVWRKDGTGFTAGELITEILNRTTKAGLEVGGDSLPDAIKQRLMAELDQVTDKLQSQVKAEATKAADELKKEATEGVEKALQDATQGENPGKTIEDTGKKVEDDLKKLKNPFK